MTSTKDRKPIEDWMYIFAFWIPFILFAIGIYLLWTAKQVPISDNQNQTQPQGSIGTEITMNIKVEGRSAGDSITIPCCGIVVQKEPETGLGDIEVQTPPDEAYQYFLLGSIIFILLLVLPRLKELTISKDSISFELVQEIEEQVQEVQALVTPSEGQTFTLQDNDSDTVQNKLNDINRKIEIIKLMASRRNGNQK